jgi:hypothetical protein
VSFMKFLRRKMIFLRGFWFKNEWYFVLLFFLLAVCFRQKKKGAPANFYSKKGQKMVPEPISKILKLILDLEVRFYISFVKKWSESVFFSYHFQNIEKKP